MISSLDTNAVLALLLNERLAHRKKVHDLLERTACFISDLVFPEVEYVLRIDYGLSRQQIAYNINALMSVPNIKCNIGLLLEATDIYVQNPTLSFTDCCLAVEAALTKRSPLYTFDKKLAKQAGGLAKLVP